MAEIRNRIITISGNPGSGKSTIISQLKKDYEEKGYKVHIISVGEVFRELAKERGMSVGEFNKFASENSEIDRIIDSKVAQRAKEINSKQREEEVFIFDSRLAAFLDIEGAINIMSTVEDRIAGQRVFEDKKRGEEDKYSTPEEAIKETKLRKECERARFLKIYGYDIQDVERYNMVIDTSYSNVEDIAKTIEECLELRLEGKKYGKMWTSPKTLLPLQDGGQTYGGGLASGTLEEMVDKLRKDGYDPNSKIEIVEAYGRKYIIDGHHRNFAAAYIGNTLVPYITVAKDNESVSDYGDATANMRAKSLIKKYLFDHEEFFDKKDEKGKTIEMFSYEYVYPGIYKELDERDNDWYI